MLALGRRIAKQDDGDAIGYVFGYDARNVVVVIALELINWLVLALEL